VIRRPAPLPRAAAGYVAIAGVLEPTVDSAWRATAAALTGKDATPAP